jgi:predicted permease
MADQKPPLEYADNSFRGQRPISASIAIPIGLLGGAAFSAALWYWVFRSASSIFPILLTMLVVLFVKVVAGISLLMILRARYFGVGLLLSIPVGYFLGYWILHLLGGA